MTNRTLNNDRAVRVCLFGPGRAGLIHGANFNRSVPGATLVAVVDPDRSVAEKASRELGAGRFYTSASDAFNDGNIDAVVIAAPTLYHRDIAVAAAQAGKHILCEKPMAVNEEECTEMIAAAAGNKVVLQIAFMRRFDAGFLHAKSVADSGEIGAVVLVKSLTRGPSIPRQWMYDIGKSNGPLAEVNSHDIDTLRWFTGSEVETVYAIGSNYRSRQVREEFPDFYDNVVLTASFRNGMQGHIDGALAVEYGYDVRVEILGTRGVILLGRTRELMVETVTGGAGSAAPFVKSWRTLFRDAYLAEDIHFIASINTLREPRVTGLDGKMAVRVVKAGNLSIAEKRVVTLA